MSTRWMRVIRGTIAAAFSTLAATVSHGIANGHAPGTLSIVLALTFAVVVGVALTGARLSAGRLAASVALSQFAFHSAFSLLGDAGGTVATAGHHSVTIVTDAAPAPHEQSVAMWAGHAVAAVLTFFMLRFGERAFWAMRDLVLLTALAILATVAPMPSARRIRATGQTDAVRCFLLVRDALHYRGPPVPSVA